MSAAAVDMPPRWAGRRCSKCGETGHRADDVRHGGKPKAPLAWRPREPGAKVGKRGPGRCALCGSLDHDRKTCGKEDSTVASTPVAVAHARWTPVDDVIDGGGDCGPAESPGVARARAKARPSISGRVRAKSVSPVAKVRELRSLALVVLPDDVARPRTRGECAQVLRPCPFVSCAHHLYLDVSPSGTIKLNFPDKEPWELDDTCALDVADAGGATLERVGSLANITRERTRQIETRALEKLRRVSPDATEPEAAGPQTFNRFAIEVP